MPAGSRSEPRPQPVGLVLLARRTAPVARRLAGGGGLVARRVGAAGRAVLPIVWTGLLVGACGASAAMLLISDLVNLRTIETGGATLERATSGPYGAYLHTAAAVAITALLLVGLSRRKPLLLAGIAGCGLVSLALGLAAYLPAALSDGGWGQRYEGVTTHPGPGLWLGLGGSGLAIASALALLRDRSRARRRRVARVASAVAAGAPARGAVVGTSLFAGDGQA